VALKTLAGLDRNRKIPEEEFAGSTNVTWALTFESGVKHGEAEHVMEIVGTSEIPAGSRIFLRKSSRTVCILASSNPSVGLVIKARAL
jgi:hypothetical protein